MKLRAANFQIDSLGDQLFNGFSADESWNGFACPYFTYSQALQVAGAFRAVGWAVYYDEAGDKFVFIGTHASDEQETFAASIMDRRKYYPIGSRSWIWSEESAPVY